jgi:hypothetical protein
MRTSGAPAFAPRRLSTCLSNNNIRLFDKQMCQPQPAFAPRRLSTCLSNKNIRVLDRQMCQPQPAFSPRRLSTCLSYKNMRLFDRQMCQPHQPAFAPKSCSHTQSSEVLSSSPCRYIVSQKLECPIEDPSRSRAYKATTRTLKCFIYFYYCLLVVTRSTRCFIRRYTNQQ